MFAHGGSEEMARPAYEVAEMLVAHRRLVFPRAVAPSRIGLFVLTRAVDGVIRTANYEAVESLHARAFEDELVSLVRGYAAKNAHFGKSRFRGLDDPRLRVLRGDA